MVIFSARRCLGCSCFKLRVRLGVVVERLSAKGFAAELDVCEHLVKHIFVRPVLDVAVSEVVRTYFLLRAHLIRALVLALLFFRRVFQLAVPGAFDLLNFFLTKREPLAHFGASA